MSSLADRDFGFWLAGFIDGEASFNIRRNPDGSYVVRMVVKLRADDAALLDDIRKRTGLGRCYDIAAAGTSQPQRAWQVERKTDALALCRVLDDHPLQSKKARDYRIWREAVMAWHAHRQGAGWDRVIELKAALEAGRLYDAVELEDVPAVFDGQLALIEGKAA